MQEKDLFVAMGMQHCASSYQVQKALGGWNFRTQSNKYQEGTIGYEIDVLRYSELKMPFHYKYVLSPLGLGTPERLAANWDRVKALIQEVNGRSMAAIPRPQLTLHDVYVKWRAGENSPIGFYSDSTTGVLYLK